MDMKDFKKDAMRDALEKVYSILVKDIRQTNLLLYQSE